MSGKDEETAVSQQDKKKLLFCMEKGSFLHGLSHCNIIKCRNSLSSDYIVVFLLAYTLPKQN